jgi:UDP-3-O-[3-hydroxymyristoyl] glucosamine N-acyltransferase
MAVYRFKVYLEDNEDIYRDIDIKASHTFEEFHKIIQEAFKFDAKHAAAFFVSDDYYNQDAFYSTIPNIKKIYDCNVYKLSNFNTTCYDALVSLSNIDLRKEAVSSMPKNTSYYTYIDKYAHIINKNCIIGKGSVVCAGTIITNNIKIGDFSHININTTIGHDTITGSYFTTAPGVNVSGNCVIGNSVYCGTNSAIREKVKICDNVVLGLNAGVVKDITVSGVYTGTPCKKM